MRIKLSEIFILTPNKSKYTTNELCMLNIRPAFIRWLADVLSLTYVANQDSELNLCFADAKEVRPEYRTTFNNDDILKCVFAQMLDKTINAEQDVVITQNHLFFP